MDSNSANAANSAKSANSANTSNTSNDPSASLSARRAKLRGALGGASTSPTYPTESYGHPSYSDDNNYLENSNYNLESADPYGTSAYTNSENINVVDVNVYGVPVDIASSDKSQSSNQSEEAPVIRTSRVRRTTQSNIDTNKVNNQINQTTNQIKQSQSIAQPIQSNQAPAPAVPTNAPQNKTQTVSLTPDPATLRQNSSLAKPVNNLQTMANTTSLQPAKNPSNPSISTNSAIQDSAVELINSIDQSLNVCATNLAALQNLSTEQTDVLKNLSKTLQDQTLFEIGLNLNSLTESLTAALEPMKAIGELVPALDALVTSLEGKSASEQERFSPDQLVTSLADQLSAGLIDPWTFKCAYMAVYPDDHPADLLHRLVELLGTQRLTGDLFRAAYEAVQGAEPPPRYANTAHTPLSARANASTDNDNIKVQLEALDKANKDLLQRQEEREKELTELLTRKESELQILSQQLSYTNNNQDNDQIIAAKEEEFKSILERQDEEFRAVLESKDMDLMEKDAEVNNLRAQIEELRHQTEEMIKTMQYELQDLRETRSSDPDPGSFMSPTNSNSANNSQNFFDSGPARSNNTFDSMNSNNGSFSSDQGFAQDNYDSRNNFNQSPSQFQQTNQTNSYNQANNYQQANTQPLYQQAQQQAPSPAPAPQAPVPTRPAPAPNGPATTPFSGQSGNYGMGVRQQVFEVIVRQALAGAPWREICAGPMQVNNISPDEVEAEVKRRQSMMGK